MMLPVLRPAMTLMSCVAAFSLSGAANAEYFVRPVLQYYGSMEDGLSLNALSTNSATFNDGFTHLESHVDLADGTIKTYLSMNGPTSVFGGATGVMGDRIVYTGDSDVPVQFRYEFDTSIVASQMFSGTPADQETRYIGIEAHFAIYETGSDSYWADWTAFGGNAGQALFVDYDVTTFHDMGDSFSYDYASWLGTDLYLTSGKSYDIFAAFNLIVTPGTLVGPIEMDSLHTSRIGISAPGGSFTSESGTFLGFGPTPANGAVPEPATWAMMIAGFGLAGAAMRRRATVRLLPA